MGIAEHTERLPGIAQSAFSATDFYEASAAKPTYRQDQVHRDLGEEPDFQRAVLVCK